MINYNTQQIRGIYSKLPNDIKEAIFSVDVSDKIIDIGKKHKLAVDKIGIIGNETSRVMLGVTHPNEFIGNLTERLEVDKEKARAIAGEINEQVFKKVRESLRKIHNMREEAEEEKVADVGHSVSNITEIVNRSDILKEIEKDHSQENLVPDIMKGDTNPFEEKMKEGVLIAPVEEKRYVEESAKMALLPEPEKSKKYQGFDPYREQLE
ncbi:MAG: hypothetical protein A2W59_02475 [Candidatus Terrybacteria bacterium RIFCSPHIGHO2_02_41_19]|uniref:Uncharacterized protein n=1 Tax=Candidatus Terrybacteria bacterium RIFCSPHIGHO2_02_41_19 TaxID=1802364 RepID=A0A1G2PPJ6_9BACT|nr:MAG: hypothetical protein A2W59_02475 [Candidatus Terrybacteria bacterium RIFCSPHIGHO2_02_41_19]